jgi:hypothetical protein
MRNTSLNVLIAAAVFAVASLPAAAQLSPVNGELVGKLDSKTAKVGDSVVVKTRAAVKAVDGTAIPKGAKVVGHVTEVVAHSSENPDARMTIQFDHAELKGGQTLQIHCVIESLQPAVDLSGSAGDSGLGGAPVGGAGRGGAAAGRMAGGVAQPGASTTPAPGNINTPEKASTAPDTAIGGTTATSTQATSTATSDAGSSVHDENGKKTVVASATGIEGVSLATDPRGLSSGVLFGSKRNIHLDDGTRVVLGVSAETSH